MSVLELKEKATGADLPSVSGCWQKCCARLATRMCGSLQLPTRLHATGVWFERTLGGGAASGNFFCANGALKA